MKIIKNFIYINFVFFLFLSTNKLYSIEPPSKLVIKDLNREANNLETTKRLDKIFVNYTGWIFDKHSKTNDYCQAKGRMFDSNVIKEFNHLKPFSFILGKGLVIPGWDIGLRNMRLNDKRCLVIPSSLAYGNRRIGNIIKPNSTLIFEVELLKIIKPKELEDTE